MWDVFIVHIKAVLIQPGSVLLQDRRPDHQRVHPKYRCSRQPPLQICTSDALSDTEMFQFLLFCSIIDFIIISHNGLQLLVFRRWSNSVNPPRSTQSSPSTTLKYVPFASSIPRLIVEPCPPFSFEIRRNVCG